MKYIQILTNNARTYTHTHNTCIRIRIHIIQMDSKGRATLGRHLFNREKSITEYWYERTDPKAKLLAANIALGLGVAATYQVYTNIYTCIRY